MKYSGRQRLLAPLLMLGGLLLGWQLVATVLETSLLPSPLEVIERIVEETVADALLYHLGVTLWRVAVSFVLAFLIGGLLGIALGISPRLNLWLDPVLVLLLNIPALVLIILLYVWFGLIEAAAIAAVVLNKVPNVAVTLREGARAFDRQYSQMATVFNLSRWQQWRHILLPQLLPYCLIATRAGLALIWKIVLVVELLGCSQGIGFQLHLAFQLFDVTGILAYSFAFILVIQLLEWTVLQPLEHYLFRWRSSSDSPLCSGPGSATAPVRAA